MAEPSIVGRQIAAIKARTGGTWAQVAKAVGASSGDYARKVASGAKPGTNLAGNVARVFETGRAVHEPAPRRMSKAGTPARVRASVARTGEKSRVPEVPTTPPRSVRWTEQEIGGGRRVLTVHFPQGDETKGREWARGAILDFMNRAHKGHRRVSFVAHGTRQDAHVGDHSGYYASTAYRAMQNTGDPIEWIEGEADATKYETGPLTGVTITILTKGRA